MRKIEPLMDADEAGKLLEIHCGAFGPPARLADCIFTAKTTNQATKRTTVWARLPAGDLQ
jgi:hypothetical protein